MTAGHSTPEQRPEPTSANKGRRRTVRRSLTIVLALVAVLSVLLLAALNYWQARVLLTRGVENALTAQQATRADIVSDGLMRVEDQAAILADDPEVVAAISDFSAAFRSLEQSPDLLTPAESQELEAAYQEKVIARLVEAGLEAPDLAELLPDSAAGRYLQYHYIVQNPYPPDDRPELIVAESDSSEYGSVHAKYHEDLTRFTENPAVGSLLLVDDRGRIVYSTGKDIDLGTDTLTGPYRDTALALTVTQRLPAVPVGEAVIVDFERYLPAAAQPTLFAAAAVQSDGKVVGAVVTEIRVEALNAIMTSDGRWKETGLGETGETYVVGIDRLMRSDSRLWLEDPDAYAARLEDLGYEQALVDLMRLFRSTVLLQPVGTEAVEAALDGERFVGVSDDYLEHKTLTVASPVEAEEVNWVLVASVGLDEATAPLNSYTRRMLIAAAILVPIVALLGAVFASRMTRPVDPVVTTAAQVAGGDLGIEFPDLGQNEFGDLARRLNTLTSDLRAQEAALMEEERETTSLLLSALPARLVTQLQSGERTLEDLVDTATIVALAVDGLLDQPGIDQDSALELSVRLSREFEEIAADLDLERVRSSSTQHVFAAGLAIPGAAAPAAAEFVMRLAEGIERFAEENGLDLSYTAGLCAGEVVAGLLEADQLTYGVFGDAARIAVALESIATPGQILVCDAAGDLLEPDWILEAVPDLIDLRGEPVAAKRLVSRAVPTTDVDATDPASPA